MFPTSVLCHGAFPLKDGELSTYVSLSANMVVFYVDREWRVCVVVSCRYNFSTGVK